ARSCPRLDSVRTVPRTRRAARGRRGRSRGPRGQQAVGLEGVRNLRGHPAVAVRVQAQRLGGMEEGGRVRVGLKAGLQV
ncbi:MAG: hypothetical protein ACK56I_07160, partial [bacterium]